MVNRKTPRCNQCGTPLPDGSRKGRRYCAAACRTRAWRTAKARREAFEAGGAAIEAVGEGRCHPWPQFTCPECGSIWYSADALFGKIKRSDSQYCSPRCRTKAWRRRLRSGSATS